MDFKQIVMSRYATKKFDGKTIEQNKIEELFEMVRFAPSSFNIQPWKIQVVTDKDLKQKIQAVSWNQEQVTTCSHLLIFCANTDVLGNIKKLETQMKKSGAPQESTSAYIKMMTDFANLLSESDKLSWAQRQVYLALENALLGAKALGFDSCPMEGFSPTDLAKILNLPKNLVPTALCPIGYAADMPRPKARFLKEEIFF